MLDHSTLTVKPTCHTLLSEVNPNSNGITSIQRISLPLSIPRCVGHESLWVGGLAIAAWGLMLVPMLSGHPHLAHTFMHGSVTHEINIQSASMAEMTIHGMSHQSAERMGDNHLLAWMAQLGYFAIAWQVMIVAMMFPTVIPVLRCFAIASHDQPRHRLAVMTMMLGYAAVWSGFGALIFGLNLSLNKMMTVLPWLYFHPWIVLGLMLLATGIFQFTSLKALCMEQCQEPLIFVTQNYQRGLKAAWNLGISNGLSCVGCCWALMVVMVVAQFCSISWMLGLTGIMLLEKNSRFGQAIAPWVGAIFIGLGGYVFGFHQLPTFPAGLLI